MRENLPFRRCFALLMHLRIHHFACIDDCLPCSSPQYCYSYISAPPPFFLKSCLVFPVGYGTFTIHYHVSCCAISKFKDLASDSVKHFLVYSECPLFSVWLQITRNLTFKFRNSSHCNKHHVERLNTDIGIFFRLQIKNI